MSAWTLIPCLKVLRAEFDALSPNRDRGADGSIGDTAHAAGGTSDHLPDEDFPALRGKDSDSVNEVHAIDIDSTGPWPGDLTMDTIVHHILSYCQRSATDPLNEARLRYIIWNRKIYRAPNWVAEVYTGTSDPHINHAHFSAEYIASLEADTSTWHLEDLVALTDAEIVKIADTVWNRMFLSPYDGTKKYAYDFLRYAVSRDTMAAKLAPQFTALLAAANVEPTDDLVDEVVAGVLAGLTPEKIAAAIPASLAEAVAEQLEIKVRSAVDSPTGQ